MSQSTITIMERLLWGPNDGNVPTRKESMIPPVPVSSSSPITPSSDMKAAEYHEDQSFAKATSPMTSFKHDTVSTHEWPTTNPKPQRRKIITKRWRELWRRPRGIWHPTVFRIRPLAGIAALCMAIACTVATLLVLIVSDETPVDSWLVAPTVYLAIITAIANTSLALARLEAYPVRPSFPSTKETRVR